MVHHKVLEEPSLAHSLDHRVALPDYHLTYGHVSFVGTDVLQDQGIRRRGHGAEVQPLAFGGMKCGENGLWGLEKDFFAEFVVFLGRHF